MRALRTPSCLSQTRWLLAACLMAMIVSGCRGKPRPVPVSGRLTIDGKEKAQVQVVLVPKGGSPDAPRPSGFTDEQGRFTLSTYGDKDGAPAGEYAVVVQYRPLVQKRGDAEPGPNVLPPEYADPELTPLHVTVAKGSAELPPLEVRRN